ncbi:hypothetical protein BJV77DRAFT_1070039 [Russula vinacea]|nr:hypothetical protein BJV77DRAFT_1070039 [Russula vinacea]
MILEALAPGGGVATWEAGDLVHDVDAPRLLAARADMRTAMTEPTRWSGGPTG